MDSRAFFQHVDRQKAVLLAAHAERKRLFEGTGNKDAWQSQPSDGHHIFIVSMDNLDKDVAAGRVVESPIRLAAQRIIEKTHEVATKAQIDAHHAYQVAEKKRMDAIDQQRKQQFVVNVPAQGVQQVDTTSPMFQAALQEAVKRVLDTMAAGQPAPASNDKKPVPQRVPVPSQKES